MELTAAEIRVLGCLVEKQRTTPEAYPLTLNALRLACNQSTNRSPVLDFDQTTVREAAERLARGRYARFTTGHGSRVAKYRQLLDEALGVGRQELALLCVLMLRGPQTAGELKARSDRLHPFEALAAVEDTLGGLIERGFVARLGRRPGQKEERYAQLLGGEAADADEPETTTSTVAEPSPAAPQPVVQPDAVDARVARLEAEVRELRDALDALRRDLGA